MLTIFKCYFTTIFILIVFLAWGQSPSKTLKIDNTHFLNPIFYGDYADPSLLRDGDDYYIVHSSFNYYPGLLIWHSKDLINWNPVTHALHKYVGSVWAPDLVKYKNRYYIYFPANNTNYVVTASSMAGPWSDPIDLKIGSIDPGHITDDKGGRYLYFSGGCYVPLAEDGLSVAGEVKYTYSGWPIPRDWSIECFCLESPKLVKRGEYYYITMAEGGTAGPATSHMVVSARSKSIFGPWENSPYNPIIRTKSSIEKWWSKGHGTLFEDAQRKWWMVYHAYEKDHYNMGRQTLLEPIEWTNDGWWRTPANVTSDQPIKKTTAKVSESKFTLSDNFSGSTLGAQWGFYDEYDTTRFRLVNNSLAINGKGDAVSNCSPLLCVPSDHSYRAQVELSMEGNAIGGLILFYNNDAYSGIAAAGGDVLAILRGWQFPTEKKVLKDRIYLRLENLNNTINMFYSNDGEQWQKIENSVEVSSYNHNVLGGFLSLRLGLCSMGKGKVTFKNFKYEALK